MIAQSVLYTEQPEQVQERVVRAREVVGRGLWPDLFATKHRSDKAPFRQVLGQVTISVCLKIRALLDAFLEAGQHRPCTITVGGTSARGGTK